MKNRSFHSGIKQTPDKDIFGIEPRVGLITLHFPNEVMSFLDQEEDSGKVIEDIATTGQETQEDSNSEGDIHEKDPETYEEQEHFCNKCRVILLATIDQNFCLNCITEDNIKARQSLILQAKKTDSYSDKTHPPANLAIMLLCLFLM